ncbi:hypothetical protein ACQPU1_04235 [Clostridium paraputrificum]|uniref:hypothetical protein n=1 Tax=Clostridium paraputrificum TaxID=29363 RepID=UPI003D33FFD7
MKLKYFNSYSLGLTYKTLKFNKVLHVAIIISYTLLFWMSWGLGNSQLNKLDLDTVINNGITTIIDPGMFITCLVTIIIYIDLSISEISNSDELNSEGFALAEFLPIKKKDFLGSRVASFFMIVACILPMFIVIYFSSDINGFMIGIRGMLLIVFIAVSISATLDHLSKYNKRLLLPARVFSKVLGIVTILTIINSIRGRVDKLLLNASSNEFLMFIGNKYIGISIGLIVIIAIYYFNWIYLNKHIVGGIEDGGL